MGKPMGTKLYKRLYKNEWGDHDLGSIEDSVSNAYHRQGISLKKPSARTKEALSVVAKVLNGMGIEVVSDDENLSEEEYIKLFRRKKGKDDLLLWFLHKKLSPVIGSGTRWANQETYDFAREVEFSLEEIKEMLKEEFKGHTDEYVATVNLSDWLEGRYEDMIDDLDKYPRGLISSRTCIDWIQIAEQYRDEIKQARKQSLK